MKRWLSTVWEEERREDSGEEVKRDGSICLDVKRCHVLNCQQTVFGSPLISHWL